MCLYMSVPQWLNLQNFFKAINESINHTIDVTVMFIYFKCLNKNNNNNNNHSSNKNINKKNKHHSALTTTTARAIGTGTTLTAAINVDKSDKIDFNANLTQINIENYTCCKTNVYNVADNQLTNEQQNYLQQHNHYQNNIQANRNQEQTQMLNKFKTLPLHI